VSGTAICLLEQVETIHLAAALLLVLGELPEVRP
jgi:hypothetical protein